MISPKVGRRYAELIGGAEHVTLGGEPGEPSSHALVLEHPQKLADLVARHVAAAS